MPNLTQSQREEADSLLARIEAVAKGPADGVFRLDCEDAALVWARLCELREDRDAVIEECQDEIEKAAKGCAVNRENATTPEEASAWATATTTAMALSAGLEGLKSMPAVHLDA